MQKKRFFDLFATVILNVFVISDWQEIYQLNHKIFQGLSFLVIGLLLVSTVFDIISFIKKEKDFFVSRYVLIPAFVMYIFVYGSLTQNSDYTHAGYMSIIFISILFFYKRVLSEK